MTPERSTGWCAGKRDVDTAWRCRDVNGTGTFIFGDPSGWSRDAYSRIDVEYCDGVERFRRTSCITTSKIKTSRRDVHVTRQLTTDVDQP